MLYKCFTSLCLIIIRDKWYFIYHFIYRILFFRATIVDYFANVIIKLYNVWKFLSSKYLEIKFITFSFFIQIRARIWITLKFDNCSYSSFSIQRKKKFQFKHTRKEIIINDDLPLPLIKSIPEKSSLSRR